MSHEQGRILAKLQDILRIQVGYTGPVHADLDIRQEMGLDSLQQMTFIVETENAFRLCFEAQAEAELATLGDMAGYIQAHQGHSASAPQAPSGSPP